MTEIKFYVTRDAANPHSDQAADLAHEQHGPFDTLDEAKARLISIMLKDADWLRNNQRARANEIQDAIPSVATLSPSTSFPHSKDTITVAGIVWSILRHADTPPSEIMLTQTNTVAYTVRYTRAKVIELLTAAGYERSNTPGFVPLSALTDRDLGLMLAGAANVPADYRETSGVYTRLIRDAGFQQTTATGEWKLTDNRPSVPERR